MSEITTVHLIATAAVGAVIAAVITKLASGKSPRSSDGIKIYYHAACKAFTGRADAIVRMLEHAGCAYEVKEPGDTPAKFAAEKGCFAVPFVEFADGLVMSQSPAIHQELGKVLGLYPATAEGEAQAMQIALNAADIIGESPKKLKENKERMNKWLGIFEGSLKTAGSGYFVGDRLTFADFSCYMPLKLILALADKGAFPRVEAWVSMMDDLPKMKAFNAKGIAFMPPSMTP